MRKSRLFAVTLILLTCWPAIGARAAEIQVARNIFLVKDKPGTPLSFHMLVDAGCWDEAGGQCKGLAHYLEHLILVGRNAGHKDAAVRMFSGGYANGWTSPRATAYVHSVPNWSRADLEQLFTFYAARLKDFTISEEEAARERNVVLQEHDWRIASRPAIAFSRDLLRVLVPDHVGGQWTIGTRETIAAFTLDEARAFHKAWYAINNVVFAVKGDIEEAELAAIAGKALAGLEPQTLPPRNFFQPVAVTPGREDHRRSHATMQRSVVSYRKLLRMDEPDIAANRAARQMLLTFLRGELPGSLNHAVNDAKPLAAGRPNLWLDRIAPQTFVLSIAADCAPDVAAEALLAEIASWVDDLASAPLAAEALQRLQRRYAATRANADKDPAQVYSRLVSWLTGRNRYEDYKAWPDRIAAVTPEAVHRMQRALAGPGRIVTGILQPVSQGSGQ